LPSPASRQARAIRTAISPRLAIKTFCTTRTSLPPARPYRVRFSALCRSADRRSAEVTIPPVTRQVTAGWPLRSSRQKVDPALVVGCALNPGG
ncbi:MAG: hypothetical protein WKF51_10730, partial [Geodermatophilaceae bacterium]